MQSQRIDEMKVLGGTLIARVHVMGSDTELELFDNFCVKYVGAIDKIFSSFSKKIRSMINLHCWSHCTGAWGAMPNKPRICYFITKIFKLYLPVLLLGVLAVSDVPCPFYGLS